MAHNEDTILPVMRIIGSGALVDGTKLGIRVVDDIGRNCAILVPLKEAGNFIRAFRLGEQTAIERSRLADSQADIENFGESCPASVASFCYDLTRVRLPVLSAPLPEEFFPFIGQILVLWGVIEQYFDAVLAALLEASGDAMKPKDVGKFHRRSSKFKVLSKVVFSDHPELCAKFGELADEAQHAADNRNLLAHGKIHCSMKNYAALVVENIRNGRCVEREFSLFEIEQFFYEMSSVAGGLFNLVMLYPLTGEPIWEIGEEAKKSLMDFCRTIDRQAISPWGNQSKPSPSDRSQRLGFFYMATGDKP